MKYLTVKEIAEEAGVCLGTVYQWIKRNKLYSYKYGKKMIRKDDWDRIKSAFKKR